MSVSEEERKALQEDTDEKQERFELTLFRMVMKIEELAHETKELLKERIMDENIKYIKNDHNRPVVD